MDSPFRPGFGARPAVFVGRETHVARVEALLTRVRNSGEASPTHLVFTGARGHGKTVMLSVAADRAAAAGFLVVDVALDSVSDNVQIIASAVAHAIATQREHPAASSAWARLKDRLATLSVELNAGVVKVSSTAPPAPPAVQRQTLAAVLVDAARIARAERGGGLILAIDELQEAPTVDLVVLANAIQDAARTSQAPLSVVAAGLPQTPDLLMEAASFTERFDFRVLGRLTETDAERALLEPALSMRVGWDVSAAEAVLRAAGGSPYLIQYIGDEAWTQARPAAGDRIGSVAATAAIAEVRSSLEAGMYRGRWSKATSAEKLVIAAISDVSDGHGIATTAAVSRVLDAGTKQWSMARQSLIDQGTIEPVGWGELRFTMPGFGEFVAGQTGKDDALPSGQLTLPPGTTAIQPTVSTDGALEADPVEPGAASGLARRAAAISRRRDPVQRDDPGRSPDPRDRDHPPPRR